MWLVFVVNNGFLMGSLNSFGVPPRDLTVKAVIGIFSSWLLHADLNHIKGNSLILSQILILVALLEQKPFKILIALIGFSGLMTWLLGSPNSVHVGASGLVFAIFGYVLGSSIFGKKFLYAVVLLLVGFEYWFTLKEGLIPQNGVSFAAHFGGFVAGILAGYMFRGKEVKYKYERTFKQKWNDFVWKVKYKFKNLLS